MTIGIDWTPLLRSGFSELNSCEADFQIADKSRTSSDVRDLSAIRPRYQKPGLAAVSGRETSEKLTQGTLREQPHRFCIGSPFRKSVLTSQNRW